MKTALQIFLCALEGTKTRDSFVEEVREQGNKVCTCNPLEAPCYKHRVTNSMIDMVERDSFWNQLNEWQKLEILYSTPEKEEV